MSNNPTDIVTDILHGELFPYTDGGECDGCCAETMAAKVIEALDMTQETRTLPDGEGGLTIHSDGTVTATGRPCTHETRWVTAWAKP